jgi:L-amino acid N-acyltransferase YncA
MTSPEYRLIPFDESRWQEVTALADAVVPFDTVGNREWTQNRRGFASSGRERRHHAVSDSAGRLVGYGAIEQQGDESDTYRLFIVPAADELWASVGSMLYDQLVVDASRLHAQRLVMREYSRDSALIAFFKERGFEETGALLDLRAPAETNVSRLEPLVQSLELRGSEYRLVCPNDGGTALATAEELGFQQRSEFVLLTKRLD